MSHLSNLPSLQATPSHDPDHKDEVIHNEKVEIEHLELGEGEPVDPSFERKTIRKIDYRLLPILGSLYAIALIDRANISLARVAGMQLDLKLAVGNRYSVISLIFFVPYIILELPSNLVLRKVGTARWLSMITLLWGSITIGMGFTKSWGELAICRFLLGCLEAGFFPACSFVIATWYTRYETGRRMSGFYLISLVISGFSGILSYGLATMEGTAGIRGWRWIFIIEGVITCALGLLAYFLVVDFPDKNKFLTKEQTTFVLARIEKDRGDSVYEPLTWALFRKHIVDLKLWGFAFMFMASTLPSYAFAYFLPVILGGMGYDVKHSQLLTAPPYIVCAPYAMSLAWLSDKIHNRSRIMIFQACSCLTGLLLVAYHHNNHVRYFGIFLGLAGSNSNVPATLAWMNNSVLGSSKRSVGSALCIGFGGIGGILATTVFIEKEAPRYLNGLWVTVGFQFLTICIATALTIHFSIANKKAEKGEKIIEGKEGFLYTL